MGLRKCNAKYLFIPLAIGVIFLIAGCLVGFVLFPSLLEKLVGESVELKDGTIQWDRFKKVPFPLDFKVTFFTIDNPSEALKGAKPVVKQRGPYVYTEWREKVDTKISGTEATFKDLMSFKFDAKKSAPLKEDDVVNVINIPLLSLLQSLEDLALPIPGDIEKVMSEIFQQSDIFIRLKVADYTFKGVKMCDPERTKSFKSQFICLSAMLLNLRTLKYNEDKSMTFSLLYYKTQPDGPFTLNTGTEDIDLLGLITSYKGKKHTEFWKGRQSSCDVVGGRATTFAPFVKPEGELIMYSTDLCKTATLQFKEKSSFKDVDTYKFQMTPESFATAEQKNTCLCVDRTKGLDGKPHCYKEGVIDLFNCLGAQVIMSFPHLMWANKEYQDSIGGLRTKEAEADSDKFTTELHLQPHTGYPLRAGLNVQMNMVLRPMYHNGALVEKTASLHPALFPMIWVQEDAELTDELLQELRDQLLTNLVLIEVVKWGVIGLGLLAIIISTAGLVYFRMRRKVNITHETLTEKDSTKF